MRTAVDSSVLLDVFTGRDPYLNPAQQALRLAIAQGSLVASEVVWAEVRAHFRSSAEFQKAMGALGVIFEPTSAQAADEAGRAWSEYRRVGGTRSHMIPDFLVAAHALIQADALLTRDRGFSKRYFRKLKVWDPGKV